MISPLLILFLSAMAAIFALALLVAWLYPAPNNQVTEDELKQQLDAHGITHEPEQILKSTSAKEVIATLGGTRQFAVLRAFGDRYALRIIDRSQITQTGESVSINDYTWPAFKLPADRAKILTKWLKSTKGDTDA